MKLILSRKGFDSGAGGVPSPILPDGRLLALPIPDAASTIRYGDIAIDDDSLDSLVTPLTRGRIRADDGAHLDPDLIAGMLPRAPGWRPLFGQSGQAQGHLRNQGPGRRPRGSVPVLRAVSTHRASRQRLALGARFAPLPPSLGLAAGRVGAPGG